MTTKPNTNGHPITEEELAKSDRDRILERAGTELSEFTDEELARITDSGGITIQAALTAQGKVMITQKRGGRTHAIVFSPSTGLLLADAIRDHITFIPDILSALRMTATATQATQEASPLSSVIASPLRPS